MSSRVIWTFWKPSAEAEVAIDRERAKEAERREREGERATRPAAENEEEDEKKEEAPRLISRPAMFYAEMTLLNVERKRESQVAETSETSMTVEPPKVLNARTAYLALGSPDWQEPEDHFVFPSLCFFPRDHFFVNLSEEFA